MTTMVARLATISRSSNYRAAQIVRHCISTAPVRSVAASSVPAARISLFSVLTLG
jgi:hypothetical protein